MDPSVIAGLLVSASAFCVAVFGAMRHSRCTKISICGIVLERDVLDEDSTPASKDVIV